MTTLDIGEKSHTLRSVLVAAPLAHALFHAIVGFGGAVVEGPEELVDRHGPVAVVAFEISVMQMVEVVGTGSGPALSSAEVASQGSATPL